MTTIACNRKYMVGDRMCSSEDGSFIRVTKIYRRFGDIIGFCGDAYQGMKFVEAYPNISKLELTDNFEALVLRPDGIYTVDKQMSFLKIDQASYAIGTGSTVALYAMSKGLTPIQAVKEASKHDLFTGLGVVVRNL